MIPQQPQISEFCAVGSGGTPSRAKTDRYFGGSIPWVKSGELKGNLVLETEECVTQVALQETSVKLVPRGAILVAMYGATVGQVAMLGMEATTNQAVCHIVPDEGIADPRYVFHYLRSRLPEFLAKRLGGAQPNISQQIVKRTRVPLPPLPEQRRVAAILDKADAIRLKRQQATQLTEELLRSAFLEMFGDPVTNPMGWPTTKLGELAQFVGGGTPSRKEPRFFRGDICWASAKDIKAELVEDTEEHITKEAIERSATKLVAPRTILVVVKSKVLLHRLPVAITTVPMCFGQDLKGIIPDPSVPATYLARHLRIGQQALLRSARGVNTEGLTLEHLRAYQVMVPSGGMTVWKSIEQSVCKLSRTMSESRDLKDVQFNALTQRAFRGQL